MCAEEINDFNAVKDAILKEFEINPKTYMQCFCKVLLGFKRLNVKGTVYQVNGTHEMDASKGEIQRGDRTNHRTSIAAMTQQFQSR